MEVEMPTKLDAVILEREGTWVGVFLEPYLVAQAKSKGELIEELQRVLTAHIVISVERGQQPFAEMRKAPEHYWTDFSASGEPEVTIRFRLPEQSFQRPGQASLVFHRLPDAA